MEKISIIVPVYNVELYIEECLKSLVEQTYSNLEIVVVNDGSKDNSIDICKAYAEKYENIIIYNKENGGLSDARNYGIKKATGKYLMFVDSDDTLTKDACQVLMTVMEKQNADLVIGELYKDEPGKKDLTVQEFLPREALGEMLKETTFNTSACGKLFKKELFEEVCFPKGMLFEDFGTVYKLFYESEKIAYISYDVYFYRTRENSITTQPFNSRKMDIFRIADEIDAFIKINCPELMPVSKNRRTRYAISFLKEIALGGTKNEADIKELKAYVTTNIWNYCKSPYKMSSKAFGLACVINYRLAAFILRKCSYSE